MTTRAVQVRHIFQGGWATDFGPTVDNVVGQDGKISIPFLIDADNVTYELNGGPHKVGGTTKLNSTVIESGEEIRGLYDFWFQGTTGSPTQKRVIHAGTKILKDDADGSFTSIKTGLEDGKVPAYSSFDDFLIISSDSTNDVPFSWDQTTFQNLAGSPPNFAFSATHVNKSWAAGVAGNPSTLYYSVTENPEDWTSSGSGNILIDPNDGDHITGIISHRNELWVFKGPYRGSIHRITGTSPSDFARTTFIRGIGAVNNNSLFQFGSDIGFMWSDGTIHSLTATDAFGDFDEATLSRPINKWLNDHVNADLLKQSWAANDVSRGYVLFTLPIDSSATNNAILMMDYRFSPPRWSKWPAFSAACLSTIIDQTNNNIPNIYLGGNDGFIRKTGAATRSIDGTTAISAVITTPFFNYGNAAQMKTINEASVGISPKGNYNAIFGWSRDDNAQQTRTFDQGGGDVLGTADANQFTLDTSELGGASYVDRYMDLEEGGEFRSINYQIKNNGNNEDLEIHSISALIKGGARSLES